MSPRQLHARRVATATTRTAADLRDEAEELDSVCAAARIAVLARGRLTRDETLAFTARVARVARRLKHYSGGNVA